MLNKLLEFAGGKIVMALEGGYDVDSIAKYVQACIEVLLQQKPIIGSSEDCPFESTWRVIQAVREKLSSFWQSLEKRLPKKVTSMSTPYIQVVSSDSEDEYNTFPNRVSQDLEKDIENVKLALFLTLGRAELSSIDVLCHWVKYEAIKVPLLYRRWPVQVERM